ncbi:MAG: hypothetical protein F6K39_12500 [Okeania sp. SIO3B3]|nr:hypothetical protein [Okeania sp. SIO3B3]
MNRTYARTLNPVRANAIRPYICRFRSDFNLLVIINYPLSINELAKFGYKLYAAMSY